MKLYSFTLMFKIFQNGNQVQIDNINYTEHTKVKLVRIGDGFSISVCLVMGKY